MIGFGGLSPQVMNSNSGQGYWEHSDQQGEERDRWIAKKIFFQTICFSKKKFLKKFFLKKNFLKKIFFQKKIFWKKIKKKKKKNFFLKIFFSKKNFFKKKFFSEKHIFQKNQFSEKFHFYHFPIFTSLSQSHYLQCSEWNLAGKLPPNIYLLNHRHTH